MEIILPFSIRKRELGEEVEAAEAIFAKVKESPGLAEPIAAKGLPSRMTLHKVYATTANGARRLLFFCRHESRSVVEKTGRPLPPPAPERWVLLFWRDKKDEIGANLSDKNPLFEKALNKNLARALKDLTESTPESPKFTRY